MYMESHANVNDQDSVRPIRTFVLRKGRMTEGQKKAYAAYTARWRIPYTPAELSFTEIFGNAHPVIVEIGFGMGVATAQIAEDNPQINYIGIEVYQAGVGKLLGEIERRGLSNLRIIEHDAIEVAETMFPDASIAGFHVFFPDPWQKLKHHKRRLMHRPRTDLLAKKLQDGGYIYMVTDWQDYAVDAFAELSATTGLYSKYDGFAPPQTWRPTTKFEQKGIKKAHSIYELFFLFSRSCPTGNAASQQPELPLN